MLAIFSVPAMADELSDARELYNVAKNVCAGVPKEWCQAMYPWRILMNSVS
ncbi:MAG: hypothetical protein IKJ62_03290 [Alphaproteobacteria bacterium]|nr:hypothetical protein [Alphaproteobacteria bacterium]